MINFKIRVYTKKTKKLIYNIENIDFKNEIIYCNDKSYSFNEVEINKCIGLLDDKNRYVYEGDIVEFVSLNKIGFADNKGEIIYDINTGSYKIKTRTRNLYEKPFYSIYEDTSLHIIGNKYKIRETDR